MINFSIFSWDILYICTYIYVMYISSIPVYLSDHTCLHTHIAFVRTIIIYEHSRLYLSHDKFFSLMHQCMRMNVIAFFRYIIYARCLRVEVYISLLSQTPVATRPGRRRHVFGSVSRTFASTFYPVSRLSSLLTEECFSPFLPRDRALTLSPT